MAKEQSAESEARKRLPLLTEDEIVAAALRIIHTDGVDALSMRRLSRELGRSAMAPYHYVADKAELLKLVANATLSEVTVPTPGTGIWHVQLRQVIDEIDLRLHEHPGIAGILLEQMLSTDRRLLNGVMEILLHAGFVEEDVLMAYATVHTYLFGRYQVVLDGATPHEHQRDLTDTISRLTEHLPALRGRDYFDFGVDTIIDGLRMRLAMTRGLLQQP